VKVDLHCNVIDLQGISKISTLPPWKYFCGRPSHEASNILMGNTASASFKLRSPPGFIRSGGADCGFMTSQPQHFSSKLTQFLTKTESLRLSNFFFKISFHLQLNFTEPPVQTRTAKLWLLIRIPYPTSCIPAELAGMLQLRPRSRDQELQKQETLGVSTALTGGLLAPGQRSSHLKYKINLFLFSFLFSVKTTGYHNNHTC